MIYNLIAIICYVNFQVGPHILISYQLWDFGSKEQNIVYQIISLITRNTKFLAQNIMGKLQ